ncbi:MAG: hypothetical protein COA99_19590 [Moraxellaceae bacterium]|nr:MAG: hypothetical protein COA99_19590 [Moraxellaceae bacterium]
MNIQTFGLLKKVLSETRQSGQCSVPWKEVESFLVKLRISDVKSAIEQWAESNMMYVEYDHVENSADEFKTITFRASR